MSSIEELKNFCELLQKSFHNKLENITLLEKLIQFYNKPSIATEIFPDPALKSYFFLTFTPKVIRSLLDLSSLTNPEYKEAVRKVLVVLVDFLLAKLSDGELDILEAVTPIFNPESPLYKSCFGDLENEIYRYNAHITPEWRESLKEGDKIDALKEERVDTDRIEGWAVAIIKKITSDRLLCTFDGIPENVTEYYSRNGYKIGPVGLRTDGWEWRNNINVGDLLDILDTQGKWFLGTALKVKIDEGIRIVKVGFRVYLPNGSKIDEHGQRHEGWSSKYDAWIPAYSIRIQRHALDDESSAPEDSGDMLQNYPCKGDVPCVIPRFGKCYSSLYIDLVNRFAYKGGFDQIINLMRNTESIKDIFSCLTFVSAPYILYHRMYVNTKIAQFVEILMNYMSHIPEDQVRYIKERRLNDALVRIEELMRRVYTAKTKSELLIKLRTEVSISLLGVEQLEKRIQAIKIISETCKAAKTSQEAYHHNSLPTAIDTMVLSNLLKVPQLIGEIFGKRSHIELIQRSTEILKFLLHCSKITKEDFNVIWDCCTHDEQSKVEILKVIADSSNFLPSELVGFIIEKYSALPKSAFKYEDVGVLCELTRSYTQISWKELEEILDLLWDLLKGGTEYLTEETNEKVMRRFCDVITTPSRVPEDLMKKYFNECYKMLDEGNSSILALKVIRRSMIQLPNVNKDKTNEDMLCELLAEGNAISKFYKDFERHCAITRNSSYVNLKDYNEELEERKRFIIFLLKRAKYKLSKTDLEILWNNLVKNPAMPEDQKIFYTILKEIITAGIEMYVVSMSDVNNFFISTLCNEENNFQTLPLEGMQAIESLFITVNRVTEKIFEIGAVRKKYVESNYARCQPMIGPMPPDSMENAQEDEIEFRVKTIPSELIGYSTLWKIVLEATNEQVTIRAIELISKIYTKLSEELEDKIAEISNSFVDTAIQQLRLCYQRMLQGNPSRSNEIVKLVRLIEQMIDESERKGNGGITPLIGLPKGRATKLIIKNHAVDTIDESDVPDIIELNVHSKITYGQLTVLVARRFKIEPELIRLKHGNVEMTYKESAKTLEDLNIVDGESVTAVRCSVDQIPRINLLKNQFLTPKARAAFVEIYERYSKDGKMTMNNLAEFTKVCLSDPSITASNSQIKEVFSEYDKDSKGYLILDNFLNFYEDASLRTEDVVWDNLRKMGYGPDLEKLNINKGSSFTAVATVIREKLPRYLLANNPEYLSFIFSLVSTCFIVMV